VQKNGGIHGVDEVQHSDTREQLGTICGHSPAWASRRDPCWSAPFRRHLARSLFETGSREEPLSVGGRDRPLPRGHPVL